MPLGLPSALIRIRLISSQPIIFPYISRLVQANLALRWFSICAAGLPTRSSHSFLRLGSLKTARAVMTAEKSRNTLVLISRVAHVLHCKTETRERSNHKRRRCSPFLAEIHANPQKYTRERFLIACTDGISSTAIHHSIHWIHCIHQYPGVSEFSKNWPRTWFLGEIWLMMLMHWCIISYHHHVSYVIVARATLILNSPLKRLQIAPSAGSPSVAGR